MFMYRGLDRVCEAQTASSNVSDASLSALFRAGVAILICADRFPAAGIMGVISKSAVAGITRKRTYIRVLQWALPLSLFLLSTSYEFNEHMIGRGEAVTSFLSSEVLLFGIVGPCAVFAAIGYIRRMVDAQDEAQVKLERLNRQLEDKVAERTLALEQQNVELARANEQLRSLDEMKSEFVAMVSHELRAPLTILNGALEIATQDQALPQKSRGTLAIMASESRRLTDFVQTILDLSRLEAGKLRVNPGPVAIRPLLEQAASVILSQSARPLIWDRCDDLPPAWADEALLEEVLRNLIRNADKYSPPGQPIHLSACLQDGRRIRIGVRDHGHGIAPEIQASIFDRFDRGDARESAPAGWGLGLYLARKLIEAQDGAIGVRSPLAPEHPMPGSEFYVFVPIAETAEDE